MLVFENSKRCDKRRGNQKVLWNETRYKYLAEWISTFVTRAERWKSPKYLIGESYGGPRVMGLAS